MGDGSDPLKVTIEDLHPTQITVGLREVAAKQRELSKDKDERHAFLQAHLVPIVQARGGLHYIVDHHHLVRAVWQAGYHNVWCYVIGDLSNLTDKEFWPQMQARGWVYPFDAQNHRRPYSEIPSHIEGLKDDPYRSLAGFVRRAGGFVKEGAAPFVEFAWANFFRERIELPPGDEAFDKALAQAVRLAHTPAAKSLPGYTGASKASTGSG